MYDRTLRCWGRGDHGRLGYDSTHSTGGAYGDMALLGTVYLGTGKTAKTIVAGCAHTCAQLNDGSYKCWGDGSHGRLGHSIGRLVHSIGHLGHSIGHSHVLSHVL